MKSSANVNAVSRLSFLLVLFGSFLVMMVALSLLMPMVNHSIPDKRTSALAIAALQGILIFIIPAFIYARYASRNPWGILSLNVSPRWISVLGVVIIYIIGTPFLNQTIYWNSHLSLPESMASLESSMKAMEDQAMSLTETLLDTTSFWGMLVGILVIGVITGLSEELFFRGAIQKILSGSDRKWIAVWITAIVFSAMHFQFYGFIPRLLLGAFFGYLLVWTKSLWVPVIAHAINNSSVVIFGWLTKCGYLDSEFPEMIGVSQSGFPVLACASFMLTLVILIGGRKFLFNSKTPSHKFLGASGSHP